MLNYRRKNVKSLKLQRETTEKVRTRVVRLVWYTYSSGFTSLQGIIKKNLSVLGLHANKQELSNLCEAQLLIGIYILT